jgi:hypothetical protein
VMHGELVKDLAEAPDAPGICEVERIPYARQAKHDPVRNHEFRRVR